jgi:nitroreductase
MRRSWFVLTVVGFVLGFALLLVVRSEGVTPLPLPAVLFVLFVAALFVGCCAIAGFAASRMVLFLLQRHRS